MKVLHTTSYNLLTIALQGELDECCAKTVRSELDSIFATENYNAVVFDLSMLEFMDSTGIGVLLGRYKTLASQNRPVYITSPNTNVDKVLKMSGIYSIMTRIDR
ncbi:MAG: anti-sigma factor antagonist [Clostridia bacterium]|nr:anti-sigma factor antagonist [Clostridia bacterium]